MSTPKTITLQTATLRDERTLIWLQRQSPRVHWWKWDGCVVGLEDYHRWKTAAKVVVLLLTDVEEHRTQSVEEWLDTVYQASKEVAVVGVTQRILSLRSEAYWAENYDNLIALDDITASYPFLEAWDGTAADAVHLLAVLCRYHRLVDGSESRRRLYALRKEEGVRPMDFVLLTQFYRSSDKRRAKEIRECLRRNVNCKWIDRVVVLTEKDESVAWASFPDGEKIQQVVIGKRLTYADALRYVSEHLENVVVALANADIYFGETAAEIWKIQWSDRMLALLRWDDLGDGPKRAKLFGPRPDAQDAWIFSSEAVKARASNFAEVDFYLGQPGCDNAFLGHMLRHRFLLSNPALSLKVYHLHNSGVRTYRAKDTIKAPFYVHLAPTYLIDTKQEFTPRETPLHHFCHESVAFQIKSSSMSNEITYCTMLEKAGRYRWEPTVENFYFEPAIPVYRWQGGAGVTPNGLVYDLYHIYTGRHALQEETYNYWKASKVDVFTPLHACRRMAAIPLPALGIFQDWNTYLLQYLSRYLRLAEVYPDTSFWLPAEYQGRLAREGWKVAGEAIPWSEDKGCWADEVVGFLPSPSMAELGREDVTALRACFPAWQETSSLSKRCIVRLDAVFTREWVNRLREILPPTWTVEGVSSDLHAWVGADLCLVRGGPGTHAMWSSLWALPKGATLLEFQLETEVDGECQHAAHVADLRSWVFLCYKGGDLSEQLLSFVSTWLARKT